MLKRSKGITPVIAIVLLLLVTVGAVGVVYTQFQNIVDQGNTNAGFLDSTDVKFNVVTRNGSSPGTMNITLENTGEDQYNLSEIARLEYSVPGEQSIQPVPGQQLFGEYNYDDGANGLCFETSGMQEFGPGDIATCSTGIDMPDPDSEITIELVQSASDSNEVIDDYTCSPSTSSSTTC